MSRFVALAAVLLVSPPATAQSAKDLAGKYQMDADAEEVMELRPDGSASLGGDEEKWSVKGNVLTLGADSVPFQLKGNKLTLHMGPGIQLAWTRVGAAGKGLSPLQKAAARASKKKEEVSEDEADAEAMTQAQEWLAQRGQGQGTQQQGGTWQPPGMQPQGGLQQPQGGSAQDQQLRQLLLSSAWCSFTYKQSTGTSSTSRAVFGPEGTLSFGSGGETYSSGYAGTVAGQYGSSGSMRWAVQNGRLLVDEGGGMGLQDVNLSVTLNSSGYPIIKAAGKEYTRCR